MLEEKDHKLQEAAGGEKADNTEGKEQAEPSAESTEDVSTGDTDKTLENVQEEIDTSNAEDGEDHEVSRRHHIPMPDYHAMSMENQL